MNVKNLRRVSALFAALLAAALLTGCHENPQPEETFPTETTQPAPTTPPDGNPDDVTCKGSYTNAGVDADAVVATMGDAQLTNGALQVYYWLEVADFRQEQQDAAPDFDQPLDTQLCGLDRELTWQQYFLQQALDSWCSQQALVLQSYEIRYVTEENFDPDEELHEKHFTDTMPAMQYLYGRETSFQPNELHQAYLDSLPAVLEDLAAANGYADPETLAQDVTGTSAEDLLWFAQLYNRAYMYFTELSYDIAPTDEEVEAFCQAHTYDDTGKYVDLRHILLIPEGAEVAEDGTVTASEEGWERCRKQAQELLADWQKNGKTEAKFAQMAYNHSADPGSGINGGLYSNLRQGQLTAQLDAWCFDDARQTGDTEIIRTACGWHILYFSGSQEIRLARAETDLIAQMSADRITAARECYPAAIDYSAIQLGTAQSSAITAEALLYPDIAHQRYPRAPLYIQQDYPDVLYGNYPLSSHGCAVSSMAMLACYMTDEKYTPQDLAQRFGSYCYRSGTDTKFGDNVPAELGFFLEKRSYNWNEVQAALENGQPVLCLQYKGYWTSSGHYILLERMTEDGLVVVRDSGIKNYGKLSGHDIDAHEPSTLIPAGNFYWIMQKKVTTIPTCVRCGEPDSEGAPRCMFTEAYICTKCDAALQRRGNFIALCS